MESFVEKVAFESVDGVIPCVLLRFVYRTFRNLTNISEPPLIAFKLYILGQNAATISWAKVFSPVPL